VADHDENGEGCLQEKCPYCAEEYCPICQPCFAAAIAEIAAKDEVIEHARQAIEEAGFQSIHGLVKELSVRTKERDELSKRNEWLEERVPHPGARIALKDMEKVKAELDDLRKRNEILRKDNLEVSIERSESDEVRRRQKIELDHAKRMAERLRRERNARVNTSVLGALSEELEQDNRASEASEVRSLMHEIIAVRGANSGDLTLQNSTVVRVGAVLVGDSGGMQWAVRATAVGRQSFLGITVDSMCGLKLSGREEHYTMTQPITWRPWEEVFPDRSEPEVADGE